MAEVDISKLQPNSNKYKAEQAAKVESERRKLDPVVKKDGIVSTKKPLSKKFAEVFIKEDIKDVKEYIIFDVLIPGAKKLFLNTLSMILIGEAMDTGKSRSRDGRTSYSSYYRSKDRERERKERYYEDEHLDYQDIVLSRRSDAEDVVDALHERIDKFGSASIADLFDLIDVASKYTDNNYGWTSKRDIGVRRVNSGWLIDVARAKYLE